MGNHTRPTNTPEIEANPARNRHIQDKTSRWIELCAQAASESDPKKMLEIVKAINELEEKERPLGAIPPIPRRSES